jgi:hypothetical protein
VSLERCPARQFEDDSFTSIPQEGYYSADAARLRPNTLNIPVVFMRVGSVIAPAQIDSGFSERGNVRGVVQINEVLFRDLQSAGVVMNPFTAVTFSITDCRGNRSIPTLWRVQGNPLQITTRGGEAVFEFEPPLLEIKPTPTSCGGIAVSPEPMGQIGAEYLQR